MSQVRTYQVCFYVGNTPPVHEGMQTINVTPKVATEDAIHEAVAAAGFSGADLRSRAVFLTDVTDHDGVVRALGVYSELMGLARRCLDVAFSPEDAALVMSDLQRAVSTIPTRRPEHPSPLVVVSEEHIDVGVDDAVYVNISQGLSSEQASLISYAKRCVLSVGDDPARAFPQFIAVQTLRRRGEHERLPEVLGADGSTISSEACRRNGDMLRRSLRGDNRTHVVEPSDLTARQAKLLAAAALPVREVLTALGGRSAQVTKEGEDGPVQVEVWHCLHPENHTNGDATPSARVISSEDGTEYFRCFKCLPEKADSLALSMWALNDATADEAAEWLALNVPKHP